MYLSRFDFFHSTLSGSHFPSREVPPSYSFFSWLLFDCIFFSQVRCCRLCLSLGLHFRDVWERNQRVCGEDLWPCGDHGYLVLPWGYSGRCETLGARSGTENSSMVCDSKCHFKIINLTFENKVGNAHLLLVFFSISKKTIEKTKIIRQFLTGFFSKINSFIKKRLYKITKPAELRNLHCKPLWLYSGKKKRIASCS